MPHPVASRHAPRLRPTPQGWSVAALCGLFLSSLLWPERPLPFTLGLALLLCLGLAIYLVPRRLRGIDGRWLLPATIHAGEEVTVGALLHAVDGSPPVTLGAWDPHTDAVEHIADLAGLSTTPTRVAWSVRFPHRGAIDLPPLVVRNEQPFGLLAAQHPVGAAQRVLVRPAVGRLAESGLDDLRRWLEEGATSHETGDDEISHLRPYRPGDPMRRINWRISARARQLLVTQRQAPACHRLALVVDTAGPRRRSRRFERLIVVAATFTDHLLRLGWSISLHGSFAPRGGVRGDRDALLDALAQVQTTGRESDSAALEAGLPRGDAALILTLDPHRFTPTPQRRILDLEAALERVVVPRVWA